VVVCDVPDTSCSPSSSESTISPPGMTRASICSVDTSADDDNYCYNDPSYDYYDTRKRRGSSYNTSTSSSSASTSIASPFQSPQGLLGLLGTLLLVWTMHSRAQRAWLLRELRVQSFEEAVRSYKELKEEHHEAFDELEYHFSRNARLEKRDEAWRHQMEHMQNATQRESWRAVMDKYGPGPHLVEFQVQLPSSTNQETFVVEMAPIKYMPHSVHVFLEQVTHGLWNESQFAVNREHVVQAGPSTKEHRQLFKDYELERLAFPEYSHYFPHEKWTLGFSGRPGGPSWYVNKLDNTEDHGPYGQEHHALDEFADSCFAKVVKGFDVLEKVFSQSGTSERTQIVSAHLVGWDEHSWYDSSTGDWVKAHDEDFHQEDDSSSSEDYSDSQDHDDWFEEDEQGHEKDTHTKGEDDHHKKKNHSHHHDGNNVVTDDHVEIYPDGSASDYILKNKSNKDSQQRPHPKHLDGNYAEHHGLHDKLAHHHK